MTDLVNQQPSLVTMTDLVKPTAQSGDYDRLGKPTAQSGDYDRLYFLPGTSLYEEINISENEPLQQKDLAGRERKAEEQD